MDPESVPSTVVSPCRSYLPSLTAALLAALAAAGCTGAPDAQPTTEDVGTTASALLPKDPNWFDAGTTADWNRTIMTGWDSDGTPLWPCRAEYAGGIHIGKSRADWTSCSIGYGGKEVYISTYQNLTVNWAPGSNGSIPSNAYAFGTDTPGAGEVVGRTLYPCMAYVTASGVTVPQPGKIGLGFSGCNVPFYGTEKVVTNYTVLTTGIPLTTVSGRPFHKTALVGGTDVDGTSFYLCQAAYKGGIHPGKTKMDWSACKIAYGGKEVAISDSTFRVPIADFEAPPTTPVIAGREANGAVLGVCAALGDSGGMQVGKYLADGHCNYGYGGGERSVTSNYGVLGYPSCGTGPKQTNPNVQVDYPAVYDSGSTRWCVDRDFWYANKSSFDQFYTHGDALYVKLQNLFSNKTGQKFNFEVHDDGGEGGATGSRFGFGDNFSGGVIIDTFRDPVSNAVVPGFWGYLFPLHEAINVFTGQVSGGWPTDWWADHRSPFPNSWDWIVLKTMGTEQKNQKLLAASAAQHNRFGVSGVGSYDSEVAMFDKIYTDYGGYVPFQRAFALIKQDGLDWGKISPTNGTALLSAYVIAYLQLGMRTTTDLTKSLFTAYGVGKMDTAISAYTVDPAMVRDIGRAHCSIRGAAAAGTNVSTRLANLQKGAYSAALGSSGTQTTCPAECQWTPSAGCTTKW
jgi:hypothetical protein